MIQLYKTNGIIGISSKIVFSLLILVIMIISDKTCPNSMPIGIAMPLFFVPWLHCQT